MDNKPATLAEVYKFFAAPGYNMAQFRAEWAELTDKDKADLKNGIGNRTYNY